MCREKTKAEKEMYRTREIQANNDREQERRNQDTITLKRVYSTHCQVCGWAHLPLSIVYFVPLDNNIVCWTCANQSGYPYEPRIYKEGE